MTKRAQVLGLMLGVGLLVGGCRSANPELREGHVPAVVPKAQNIFLTFLGKDKAPDCISVLENSTNIFVKGPPWRVKWIVRNPNDDHQWVIEYKGNQNDKDVLAMATDRVVLECRGNKAYVSGKAKRQGHWTYKVSVYECTNGQPAADPICQTDPEVVPWG